MDSSVEERYNLLRLPERPSKPRHTGISVVLDKGLGRRETEDLVETASPYIDLVKLGWGTSLITHGLTDKIKIYKEAGIPVYLGGTLFEVFLLQGRYEAFKLLLHRLEIDHVEVSDGTLPLKEEEKCEYIRDLARDFVVLSEVGSKDTKSDMPPFRWVELLQTEKQAGAWKVITEARESGTAGICRQNGEIRYGLIEEIFAKLDHEGLIFEAPTKAHQAWFVKRFGSNVNLGNISPVDVIPLETLRLGLRSDTMLDLLAQEFIKRQVD